MTSTVSEQVLGL